MLKALSKRVELNLPTLISYILLTAACFSPSVWAAERLIFNESIIFSFIPDVVKIGTMAWVFASFFILPWFCAFFLKPHDHILKFIALLAFICAFVVAIMTPAS